MNIYLGSCSHIRISRK